MEKAIAKHIIAAAEVIGLDLELRADYSGRGMYGSETVAIVGSDRDFRQAICYAAGTIGDQPLPADPGEDPEDVFDLDQFCEEVAGLRTDSVGRSSTVWY
jgi:hypothetical protein